MRPPRLSGSVGGWGVAVTGEELRALIRAGESQVVEFKSSLATRYDALQSLCGMVNSDGAKGAIIFGVAPDGTLRGVEPGNLDRAQQSLAQVIGTKFDPPLIATLEILRLDSHALVLVSAARKTGVPYHEYDGRAFIRQGTATRQLTLTEKNALAHARNRDLHPGPWKCNGCNTWVGMLAGFNVTDRGMEKSYACQCGGEFWPAT